MKSPDEGPKTLPSATLNVDDLTLSLGTTPKWSPNVSALADDSQGSAPLPEGSSAGQFTLPAMDSEEHRLDVDAQQGFEDHLDGAFAPKAAASDSELTSAQHALNEEERRTLRNQVCCPQWRPCFGVISTVLVLCIVYGMVFDTFCPVAAGALGGDCRVCEASRPMREQW